MLKLLIYPVQTVVFSLEEARIGQLFTPQAYEIMKRLELKSLLKRFEAGSQTQMCIRDRYKTETPDDSQ